MARRKTGHYQSVVAGGEKVNAFIPFGLPPRNPTLAIEGPLADRVRAAEQALRRLDLASEMVPSVDWFVYAFVRKEAVISSQIEGTQATLVDLLTFEFEPTASPDADVEEITNYLDALNHSRRRLMAKRGLPLSMRLLNEAHLHLMRGVRGSDKQPGDVRRSQNWIGGSRPANAAYVPPPPNELPQLLSDLEKYIHARDELPKLVRAGLLHAQFETIHPYLDGNGRIGRLLIALLLEHWGLLKAPLLYISLFFKRHQQQYYQRLNLIRLEGDWEGWLDFFLDGIAVISDEATASAQELFRLINTDRARLVASETASVSAIRLFEELPRHPIVDVTSAMRLTGTTKPTAARAIAALASLGVLAETTGKRRDRRFVYKAYLEHLKAGTELELR